MNSTMDVRAEKFIKFISHNTVEKKVDGPLFEEGNGPRLFVAFHHDDKDTIFEYYLNNEYFELTPPEVNLVTNLIVNGLMYDYKITNINSYSYQASRGNTVKKLF